MSPILESQRVQVSSLDQPYGLCDIGHQGLMHDKEFDLIHNRARMLHPRLGRFIQRDPIGYKDGMSLYEYVGSGPVGSFDPSGTKLIVVAECKEIEELLKTHTITGAKVKQNGKKSICTDSDNMKWVTHSVEMETLWKMIRSKKAFSFKSIQQLKTNLLLRRNIVAAAIAQGNCNLWGATSGFEPPVDPDGEVKWQKGDLQTPEGENKAKLVNMWFSGTYKTSEGKTPAAACLFSTRLVIFKGMLDTLGAEDFNKLRYESGKFAKGRSPDNIYDWLPGEWGYVKNKNISRTVDSYMQGENIIYLYDITMSEPPENLKAGADYTQTDFFKNAQVWGHGYGVVPFADVINGVGLAEPLPERRPKDWKLLNANAPYKNVILKKQRDLPLSPNGSW